MRRGARGCSSLQDPRPGTSPGFQLSTRFIANRARKTTASGRMTARPLIAAMRQAGVLRASYLEPIEVPSLSAYFSRHSSRDAVLSSTAAKRIIPLLRSTARPNADPTTGSI